VREKKNETKYGSRMNNNNRTTSGITNRNSRCASSRTISK